MLYQFQDTPVFIAAGLKTKKKKGEQANSAIRVMLAAHEATE